VADTNAPAPIHADPALEEGWNRTDDSSLEDPDGMDDSASARGDGNRGFISVEPRFGAPAAQILCVTAAFTRGSPSAFRSERDHASNPVDERGVQRCIEWLSEQPHANPLRVPEPTQN